MRNWDFFLGLLNLWCGMMFGLLGLENIIFIFISIGFWIFGAFLISQSVPNVKEQGGENVI